MGVISDAMAKSFTTTFPLTENPISESGIWTNVGLDWTVVRTSGGLAFGTEVGGGFDDSYAHLSGFGPDHMAWGVVHIDPAIQSGINHEVEILLRWADSPHVSRGYECNWAWDGAYTSIVRWNGALNDFTTLRGPSGTQGGNGNLPRALTNGDVVSASMVGNLISLYWNGILNITATDSMWIYGNPGMGFFRGAVSSPQSDVAFSRYDAVDLPQAIRTSVAARP